MRGHGLRGSHPGRRLAARVLATAHGRRLLDEIVRLVEERRPGLSLTDEDQPESLEQRRRIQSVLNIGDTLRIVFQPIVELGTLRVVGYEALSRFDSDRPANEWYAEAQAVGLGVELEMLAISRAVADPPPQGYLSVNVSPSTLASDAFREFLDERMWGRLVVELTEHVGIDDYASLDDTVTRLRDRGGRLAVDDAGSGYASMRHVVSLCPDIIKIDRSLIASMDRDSGRRELARSLSRFARSTGASVVAEGIERPEEYDTCRQVGIDCGQGYLFGAPAPLERLTPEERITGH